MTNNFTERLYTETIDAHKIVDRHPFVESIRHNKDAGNLYINFNKICIYIIQKKFQESFENNEFLSFKDLFNSLYRDIPQTFDFYISPNLGLLLEACEKYPLEHAYMFYLGLLKGGNILKKSLPTHTEFLHYNNSKELVNNFKKFLDDKYLNIKIQDNFIDIVKHSYSLIEKIFGDYQNKCIYTKNNLRPHRV
jgi:hypothetical protein